MALWPMLLASLSSIYCCGVDKSGMSRMLPVFSSPLSCRKKMRRIGCRRRCCNRLSARFLAILSAKCLTSSVLSRRFLCLSHNFSSTSPATSSASSLPSSNDIALSTAICRSSVTSDMYFRRSILILQRKSENATQNLHFFQKTSSPLFFWLKSGRGCAFSILARLDVIFASLPQRFILPPTGKAHCVDVNGRDGTE